MIAAYRLRQLVADLLFPVECFGCAAEGEWICPACRRASRLFSNRCLGCGDASVHGEMCTFCRQAWALTGTVIAGDYDDPVIGAAVRAVKYRFAREAATAVGECVAMALARQRRLITGIWSRGASHVHPLFTADQVRVIPVPLHPRRLRWRGFNQAASLAYPVAEAFDWPLDTVSLQRTAYRRPQAVLAETARLANVQDSFAWRGSELAGVTVVLVDDVITTGATLEACAQVLKTAGAAAVWGVAAAKG